MTEHSLSNLALAFVLFVAVPIAGAVKFTKASVPIACVAWLAYFGALAAYVRSTSAVDWSQALGWTVFVNIFTGLGVLPTALTALLLKKVVGR